MSNEFITIAKHIFAVQQNMNTMINNLMCRMVKHDQSKYTPNEISFMLGKEKLNSLEYDTDEYYTALLKIKRGILNHYKFNSHHPEYYENGIQDMSLFDLIEMLADWKATSQTDIYESIKTNKERFSISEQLEQVFVNTAKELKW